MNLLGRAGPTCVPARAPLCCQNQQSSESCRLSIARPAAIRFRSRPKHAHSAAIRTTGLSSKSNRNVTCKAARMELGHHVVHVKRKRDAKSSNRRNDGLLGLLESGLRTPRQAR